MKIKAQEMLKILSQSQRLRKQKDFDRKRMIRQMMRQKLGDSTLLSFFWGGEMKERLVLTI